MTEHEGLPTSSSQWLLYDKDYEDVLRKDLAQNAGLLYEIYRARCKIMLAAARESGTDLDFTIFFQQYDKECEVLKFLPDEDPRRF